MWFTSSPRYCRTVRHPSRPRRSFVPRLEILEDRTVPSTLKVTNNLDSGAGSLRDTIKTAKSSDTIVFAPSLNGQTITLTSGELAISNSMDIEGPGSGLLAISGNDTYRVFDISQGLTVTITGLTITHGQVQAGTTDAGGNGGGGILNAGSLTIANDVLSSNQSDTHGGAISNGPAAVLTVTDSLFTGNEVMAKVNAAHVEGGAIWSSGESSTATVIGSTFIGNRVIGGNGQVSSNGKVLIGVALGGAIHNDGKSTLTVQNSTFIGNQAIGGNNDSAGKNVSSYFLGIGAGGAITNDEGLLLVVSGCTFAYNQAIGGSNNTGDSSGFGYAGLGRGGALSTFSGAVAITNCTFDHNEALGGNGNTGGGALLVGVGDGGAILSDPFGFAPHPLTVSNSTFTNNQAIGGAGNTAGLFVGDGMGGGLENFRGATATVTGSTFSGNSATGGAGGAGQNGGDGLGGAIANLEGSTLTVSGCTLSGNSATGGVGGAGANGGNGFGGGIYNDGTSTLTMTGSTITSNSATGGAAGNGGSAGEGIGGGAYFAVGGSVCLDAFAQANVKKNQASTSYDDIFGDFTTCS